MFIISVCQMNLNQHQLECWTNWTVNLGSVSVVRIVNLGKKVLRFQRYTMLVCNTARLLDRSYLQNKSVDVFLVDSLGDLVCSILEIFILLMLIGIW